MFRAVVFLALLPGALQVLGVIAFILMVVAYIVFSALSWHLLIIPLVVGVGLYGFSRA